MAVKFADVYWQKQYFFNGQSWARYQSPVADVSRMRIKRRSKIAEAKKIEINSYLFIYLYRQNLSTHLANAFKSPGTNSRAVLFPAPRAYVNLSEVHGLKPSIVTQQFNELSIIQKHFHRNKCLSRRKFHLSWLFIITCFPFWQCHYLSPSFLKYILKVKRSIDSRESTSHAYCLHACVRSNYTKIRRKNLKILIKNVIIQINHNIGKYRPLLF